MIWDEYAGSGQSLSTTCSRTEHSQVAFNDGTKVLLVAIELLSAVEVLLECPDTSGVGDGVLLASPLECEDEDDVTAAPESGASGVLLALEDEDEDTADCSTPSAPPEDVNGASIAEVSVLTSPDAMAPCEEASARISELSRTRRP